MKIDRGKLRSRSAELDFSQKKIASLTGISDRTIATIFKTGEIKTADHVGLIADALGVDMNWLQPLNEQTYIQDGTGNAIGSKNIQTTINANPSEKTALMAQIERLEKDNLRLETEKDRLLKIIEQLSNRRE